MKILSLNQYGDFDGECGDLYVGNEFSPDPSEMVMKIRNAYPITREVDDKSTRVQAKRSVYDDLEDIERLLAKNGYTIYKPKSILVVDDIDE